jgi:oxygen-dependent protoporphyrinogen oxidase
MQLDAIILGAGPAGLAVANAMVRQGARVKVIEPSARPGGSIRTVREDGWLVETGPNTLQIEGEADHALLNSYGLGTVLQEADHASAKRFILAKGRLHALTNKPSSLFKGDLLTWRGKLRFLSEIFRPRGGYAEETVQAFMTRRFGAEAADLLMDPVVSGVHAGDPGRLCMSNSFPSIPALEASHRSVILGLMRQPPKGRSIIGFPAGMQQLADAMAAPLRPEALQLGSMATLIRQDARGWNVAWRNAQGQDDGASAKHLIVTAPHWQWASLPFDEELKKTFREWERAEAPPVTVVARGYDRSAIAHPLDGFGYLIPGNERRAILGCLFPSTVLPGRKGAALLLHRWRQVPGARAADGRTALRRRRPRTRGNLGREWSAREGMDPTLGPGDPPVRRRPDAPRSGLGARRSEKPRAPFPRRLPRRHLVDARASGRRRPRAVADESLASAGLPLWVG